MSCAGPEGWETLKRAWNAGPGRKWTLPQPPEKTADRLAEEGWFGHALAAIDRLPKCRFFTDPVTLIQFVKPGFVEKVLGGQYDSPRQAKAGRPGEPEARPVAAWTGDDARRFEETKRKMVEQLKKEASA